MAKVAKPTTTKTRGKVPTNIKRRAKNKSESMTENRWKRVVEAVANGKDRKEAAKFANISKMTLDAYLVTNVIASSQLHEAKLLWFRREWPDERIDEVLERIMRGDTLPNAFKFLGISEEHQSGIYRLMLRDNSVKKRYDEAREIQAETFVDDIITIADETENDFLENGKGNHELVNRSRLRVDTRKFVMSTMNGKRFSEKKQIEHSGDLNINHAAVLSGGRKRIEQLDRNRKGITIDNETGEPAKI